MADLVNGNREIISVIDLNYDLVAWGVGTTKCLMASFKTYNSVRAHLEFKMAGPAFAIINLDKDNIRHRLELQQGLLDNLPLPFQISSRQSHTHECTNNLQRPGQDKGPVAGITQC